MTATLENREWSARKSREQSASVRDIGDVPAVVDPRRRDACKADLARFLKTYFPGTFRYPFSADHIAVIAKTQAVIIDGGYHAVAMPRGFGKALAIDTPILTTSGWATMGTLSVEDSVYDESGRPCSVTFTTDVMRDHQCYRVTFDDGESVVCDAEHLWTVNDIWSRKNPLTLTTKEMASRCILPTNRGWKECRYTIPVCAAIVGDNIDDFFISPYILGAWLGDGTTSTNGITIGDLDLSEMRNLIERDELLTGGARKPLAGCQTFILGSGRRVSSLERTMKGAMAEDFLLAGIGVAEIARECGLTQKTVGGMKYLGRSRVLAVCDVSLRCRLQRLGVLNNKHIPEKYLQASEEQRLELLRGLMDTDGTISERGHAEYCTKLATLRDDVMELLAGLGIKRTCRTRIIKGRPYHRVFFTPSDGRRVFNLSRKCARQKKNAVRNSATRRITSIEPVESVPVRCIQVDSPSHLYLCGRGLVPTHNTSISEGAAIFAILYGYRRYVVVVGATSAAATDIMESIKEEIETNELLLADFPDAIFPLQALDGEPRRCLGQTYCGEKTRTQWGQKRVKFPTMPGSASSGAMIRVAGITGELRGKKGKVKGETGGAETFRPDLCLIDDCQTESSALSDVQCRTRERIISGSILGLAGRGVKIAALLLATVIRAGDVADRHLDHKIHPEWNGSRHKMLYAWPTNMKLWEQYKELRLSFNPATPGEKEQAETNATEFYIDNQAAMDAGAVVAWQYGVLPDEVSVIQSAMNLWISNPRAFAAEYQNEPLPEENLGVAPLSAKQIAAKLNGLAHGYVPQTATRLTAAIDVQGDMLFWSVVAWEENFTGYIVDYGSFPEQGRVYYTKADASRTIAKVTDVPGFEGQIYKALELTCEKILGKSYVRAGGTIRVERCLIDANFGQSTNVVYQFCLQSPHAAVLLPIHGRGITASARPMSQWPKNQGERHDPNGAWVITQNAKRREVKYAIIDVNAVKSFVYKRLAVAMGSPGCLSLFGADATLHAMLADHITAEYPVETKALGRTVDEWKQMPGRDNDFFDTLVYNAAAASMQGVVLKESSAGKPKVTGERKSWSKMQQEAKSRR